MPHALNGMSEEKQFSFCHKLLLISPPKCIGCQMSRDRNRGKKFGLGFSVFGPDAFCRGGGHSVFGTVTKTRNH